MFPNDKVKCHHTGFTKKCLDMVVKNKCPKWVHIRGADPQTPGSWIDRYDCADAWVPFLLLQQAQQQHLTTATVQELRNDVAKANTYTIIPPTSPLAPEPQALANGADQKLIAQD